MGSSTTKRILLYTGLFAGGSILACPAVGLGTGAALAAAGVASLFGNTLASDVHDAFTRGSLDPLANHHLKELVGRSLAALIECYEKEVEPPDAVQKWIPFIRLPDYELTNLAKAARRHWSDPERVRQELTGESVALQDGEIHKAFSEHDRNSPRPLVSADEWDRHLKTIAEDATTWYGDKVWLNDTKRAKLAAYIAPRFALAARELVKADLDPSVGTGGRVFIGLHLDLMRAMSVSVRGVDAKTDAVLKAVESAQRQFKALSKLVIDSLSREQKGQVFDLVVAVRDENERTRVLIREGFSAQDRKHDVTHAGIARIEETLRAMRQANPAGPPELSAEDQAFLDAAKRDKDLKTRAAASVLQPDARTDDLLRTLRARHESEEFELCMLEGKRWYYDKHQTYDRAVPFFERALHLRPADLGAATYCINVHTRARLGDIAAHRRRAIEVAAGMLKHLPVPSTDWAMTQNNLGNAWADLPTGDRAANLRNAIAAYEAALAVYTRDAHPVEWATTQNNLGSAWLQMPTADRGDNLRKAIAAYEAVLGVYTRDTNPTGWAMTQNNLGNAWQSLPDGDRGENVRKAIAAYEAALSVYTRDAHPADWATTQNNLGAAWHALPMGDRSDNLRRAIAAYETALAVRSPGVYPAE